jgi:predicted secreted Zn-dependent protease
MRYLVACLLALFLASSAVAEVSEDLRYTYYQVDARTNQPLWPQLLATSSIREDGKPYIGQTNWDIRWHFNWNTDQNGVCRITGSAIQLTSVIVLPKLRSTSAHQLASFDRFIIALRQHELGHYSIASEAARKIDSDLKNFPPMSNCSALEAHANATSRRTLSRFNEMSRQYDRDTNHGKTQGAWISD